MPSYAKPEDKCEVILQWIQTAVVNHIEPTQTFRIEPVLLFRAYCLLRLTVMQEQRSSLQL